MQPNTDTLWEKNASVIVKNISSFLPAAEVKTAKRGKEKFGL
jgi:hypothetical protein